MERAWVITDWSLYHEMVAADNAWQAELEQMYGKHAGDARYDERGYATDQLAALKNEYLRLCKLMFPAS